MTANPIPVSQADRDAAADMVSGILSEMTQQHIRQGLYDGDGMVQRTARHRQQAVAEEREAVLGNVATMMSEFVDNWPQPKKVSTAIALIAKTIRAALNAPKHTFWGAGEADCPRDIKAGNGELHTLRCKICGQDSPRDERCFTAIRTPSTASRGGE